MAYVANMGEEEEQNQNNPSQGLVAPAGGGGVHLSPSSGVVSGSGGGGGSAGGTKAPTPGAGGQFASLGQYVQANAPNASGLTDTVLAPINTQAQSDQSQANQTISELQGQISSGATPNNPDLLNAANSNIVSFAKDPNNVTQFQGLLNDTYAGPASAEGASSYQTTLANLNNDASAIKPLTQTTVGQEQLLQNVEKNPGNAGVTGLNQAILSQDPNSLSRIQGAAQPFQDIVTNFTGAAPGLDTQIAQQTQGAKDASAAANNVIAQNVAKLSGIPAAASAADASRNAFNTAVTNNTAILNPLSTDVKSFNEGSGLSLSDPFTGLIQNTIGTPITAANYATPEQYAEANAIDILDPNTAVPPDQSQASQAGTAPTIPTANTFDAQNLIDQTAGNATQLAFDQNKAGLQLPVNESGFQMPNDPYSESKALTDFPNGKGLTQPGIAAFENLLSLLMGQSGGYIQPNANGPAYYSVGSSGGLGPTRGGV